jgi:hypothetical protein
MLILVLVLVLAVDLHPTGLSMRRIAVHSPCSFAICSLISKWLFRLVSLSQLADWCILRLED